jgi:hypothetical protein
MGAGTSVLGFGGGFAKGLANALLQNRERSDQQAREAEAAKFRQFQTLNPVALQAAQDTGDWSAYEGFLTGYFPDLAKQQKKTGFSFQDLGPLLSAPGLREPTPVGEGQTPAAAAASGTIPQLNIPSTVAEGMPTPPDGVLPSRALVAPATPAAPAPPPPAADPRQSFLGFQMLSPEQQAERETTQEIGKLERTRTAQINLARRMLPQLKAIDESITLEDALRYVSKGELVTPASRAASGNLYRYGVDREALAKELFDKPYDSLTKQEASIVLREEKTMLEKESEARGTGTATARFNAPADIPTAQAGGVPVGTRAADVSGQAVPTQAIRERRKSVEELKENLTHIKSNLLGVLPKKGELGELAPGAVYTVRRRLPKYRTDIAKLESAINNVVNVMARSVGEQRGTQTERDALRAEAAIAQIRDALLTGDTQESASARIDESLRVLDGILGRLPTEPVPTKPAATGAPAAGTPAAAGTQNNAAPSATKDAQGNWIIP